MFANVSALWLSFPLSFEAGPALAVLMLALLVVSGVGILVSAKSSRRLERSDLAVWARRIERRRHASADREEPSIAA